MILEALRPTAVRAPGLGGYIRHTLDVPPGWEDLACDTAHAVAVDLDLPRAVTVVPYRKCSPDHPDAVGPLAPIPNGYTLTDAVDEIFVRIELAPEQLARTVAHECRHLWQNRTGLFTATAEREHDADRYAADWIRRAAA